MHVWKRTAPATGLLRRVLTNQSATAPGGVEAVNSQRPRYPNLDALHNARRRSSQRRSRRSAGRFRNSYQRGRGRRDRDGPGALYRQHGDQALRPLTTAVRLRCATGHSRGSTRLCAAGNNPRARALCTAARSLSRASPGVRARRGRVDTDGDFGPGSRLHRGAHHGRGGSSRREDTSKWLRTSYPLRGPIHLRRGADGVGARATCGAA